MGEREQKKDSEKSRENNSLKILIKKLYFKPVLEAENDEILKKIVTQFSSKLYVCKQSLAKTGVLHAANKK